MGLEMGQTTGTRRRLEVRVGRMRLGGNPGMRCPPDWGMDRLERDNIGKSNKGRTRPQ